MYIAIFAANGLLAGDPTMTELAGHGLLSMREREDAQLERKSSVKSAGQRNESRHVAYSRRLEVQEETAMEPVWGSEVKHQTNHWKNVNGV